MSEQQISFEGELKTLLKTGKVIFGARRTIKYLKLNKVKMVIIASTLRGDLKEDILYYSRIANIPVYEYKGSGWDLGTLCGKPFMISTIGVIEEGESKILDLVRAG
ncbi:MAG: 50S ribosomal protein L30e [Saccharolobus sp.]|uniref:Large ribosomal subunit protein eL30 n=1 Tax=Saccharolobus caldissimus TaxID=1702097 RepID=A0AAQ4CMT8_9CREN|nr:MULTISPECIES: 50S ribosomal protein L30e [Saccharolobus]MDT7861297.1 50S ribosomal protein L30e [Saccharolobus sp.]BDB97119.1 50S ribosomal protein L30e [Saccharolobus caldissimus]